MSRLKEFVREKSNGMSTSDQVVGPLSDKIRKMADAAIASARTNNRKTVLDRDLARAASTPDLKGEVLIVVSKLKDYVRAQSDLRTSDELPGVLSEEVRRICLFAIENARKDGRKTVMGRDIPGVKPIPALALFLAGLLAGTALTWLALRPHQRARRSRAARRRQRGRRRRIVDDASDDDDDDESVAMETTAHSRGRCRSRSSRSRAPRSWTTTRGPSRASR